MPKMLDRRMILGGIAVVVVAAAAGGFALTRGTPEIASTVTASPASAIEITEGDLVMGREDAPVTIIEYASLTCPHCAAFHANTLPALKETYVETGQVRYVYRDFPLDQLALYAAVLPRCAGGERAFAFLDILYAQQRQWATDDDPVAALRRIARTGGVSEAAYDTCLQDEQLVNTILQQRLDAAERLDVNSTPTLFINGERHVGNLTLEEIERVLEGKL